MIAQAVRADRVELADVVRAHAAQLPGLSPTQQRVLRAIADCRTAALGGHRRACTQCGHQEIAYNSCRDRHCPKCQGLEAARWMDAQQQDLLPVPYFHVVFTVPAELHDLFLAAPRVTYTRLFAAVAETLAQVAFRRFGAQIAFTAILHTWTQLLLFHPHIHCIVPGGGLDPEHTHWIAARADFFLPVRVLAQVFRGKLLAKLETAIDRAEIPRPRDEDPHALLKRAATKRWVVYGKPPFAGPDQVLAYLARYTHRLAFSNDRLVSLHEGQVTFRWKDRAHGNAPRVTTLEAETFLRRFLLHVLPHRFVRIRHYGWLANSARKRLLPMVRKVLGLLAPVACTLPPVEPDTWEATLLRLTGKDVTRCPCCGAGGFLIVEAVPAVPARAKPGNIPLRVRSP
jgi:Putative transposase/Transposase zinc-binding domain